jgi:mannosyltransferase OCH1-like enzyme
MFRFYDDAACNTFIRENFDARTHLAYQTISECYGAMRADFFRYCVLFRIGGVYVDIKSKIKVPISTIIGPTDTCVLDKPRTDLEAWRTNAPTYEQWVLMFAPQHPYLQRMIANMVSHIETRYEPQIPGIPKLNSKQKILHVTGPDALAVAIRAVNENGRRTLHRTIDYKHHFIRHVGDYLQMYAAVNKRHYSEYDRPLYRTIMHMSENSYI